MRQVPGWVWGLAALLVFSVLLGQVTLAAMREQSASLEWAE